jgi:hypothetical protein
VRPVLSDDPALAEVRAAIAMHQAFVHTWTATCPTCGYLYASEEKMMEARLERFFPWGSAA